MTAFRACPLMGVTDPLGNTTVYGYDVDIRQPRVANLLNDSRFWKTKTARCLRDTERLMIVVEGLVVTRPTLYAATSTHGRFTVATVNAWSVG